MTFKHSYILGLNGFNFRHGIRIWASAAALILTICETMSAGMYELFCF